MSDLTDFLLARIAEDEAKALKAARGWARTWRAQASQEHPEDPDLAQLRSIDGAPVTDALRTAVASFMVDHDPARVLAECEAKRQIVMLAHEATGYDMTVDMERETGAREDDDVLYVGERILRSLALPYARHADYDKSWRS
jgi:hypothetical protein